ncbi:thiamine-phosphate kinase [Desertibaculum subflavum]|uniref:thiamine-phosphate kinase n=1 Tax=Desertibaculum subflavum TaxID=2268458 RepID=UPI000E66652C
MSGARSLGEFERIATFFAPLAAPEALGLTDDAAVLAPTPGCEIVLTTDTMIGGVHFFPDDPPDLIARKLLRVNLSDLAAMGARPRGYLLASAWRRDTEDAWIARFASGLAEDQKLFGALLLGGDTTATDGPVALTLTAVGEVEAGRALRRNAARPGDEIWVSGTIGDAALGLRLRRGETLELDAAASAGLLARHQLPTPRLALGRILAARGWGGPACAAIDVSDGLIADLGHICDASGAGAEVEGELVPISAAARAALASGKAGLADLLTGGDDYELCFTLPAGAPAPDTASTEIACTRIGRIVAGGGVRVLAADGHALPLPRTGFRHF